jgi:malate dehydrogenase (oxaloacetate-decarboxylating)
MDSRGILTAEREFTDYKAELAWPKDLAAELDLKGENVNDLASVIEAYKPTVLIGTSGQFNAFDQAVVEAMAAVTARPVILPMSNPTSISEAIPEDVLRWTGGKALVATGSPFDPVPMRGGMQRIGQANNVFIFPGLGLGAIVAGASEVTDGMIASSAQALADSLTDDEIAEGCLMPEVSRLWDICGQVALATATRAMSDGVASQTDLATLNERIEAYRWRPIYPEMIAAKST